MLELVMQEPDDGVGKTLLVIHLEMGGDEAWGFQDLRTEVQGVGTGGRAQPSLSPSALHLHSARTSCSRPSRLPSRPRPALQEPL